MKYNVHQLCCTRPTHDPKKMRYCEDYSHDVASWYWKKTPLDHAFHITDTSHTNNFTTSKFVSKKQIFDHKMIGVKFVHPNSKVNMGEVYSLNMEGLCNAEKYPKEYSKRKQEFIKEMERISNPGVILCIQELLLKSVDCFRDKKCKQSQIQFIKDIFHKNNIELEYVYDDFTNVTFYDKNIWSLKYSKLFKRDIDNKKKSKTFILCSFLHKQNKETLNVLNTHLTAFLPYYKKIM